MADKATPENMDAGVKYVDASSMDAGVKYIDDTIKYTTKTQRDIQYACEEIEKMLIEKNRKYGNSALEPQRVFSKSSPEEQLKVRIDDKLSRMKSLQDDDTEDTVDDLIGYLILLKVARKNMDQNNLIDVSLPGDLEPVLIPGDTNPRKEDQ